MTILRKKLSGLWGTMLLAIAVLVGTGISNKANAQPGGQIGFQTFYDELSPYGQWFNDPQYGYVWEPNVGNDFRPYYTNGYWQMTDYGNMWMSDYNWGWAPFHYGRWTMSNYGGWVWIPGNEWGPAWVNWRQGGGYYGWAPMGPGVSINISFGSGYSVPNPWWTFIPYGNIHNRNFHRYYSPRRTVNIINNTTIINNTYVDNRSRNTYITGPRRNEVERNTGRRVNVYNVSNSNRAGASRVSGRNVQVYRPEVAANSRANNAAPREVRNIDRIGNSRGSNTNTGGRSENRGTTQPANRGNERVPNSTVRPGNVNNRAIDTRQPVNTGRNQSIERTTPTRQIERSNAQPVQRKEPVQRTQPTPRVERSTPAPQMVQPRQQPAPRVERSQPAPRVERSAPAPQRVERSQPAPQRNAAPARNAAPQRNAQPRGR